jgi:hypothetical protein
MITTNCTVLEYHCPNTSKTSIITVTDSNMSSNCAKDGSFLTIHDWTCTDNQLVFSTPSASFSSGSGEFASASAMALGNSVFVLWVAFGIVIFLLSVQLGLSFFRRSI